MITIITHPSPDGDAIGSSLGMLWFFKSIDKRIDVKVVLPDTLADNLKFLAGTNEYVLDWSLETQKEEIKHRIEVSKDIYILDFNNLERIFDLGVLVKESKGAKHMIDHHRNPDASFCDSIISDVNASSTAEMVYEYICGQHAPSFEISDLKYNKEISYALYLGIMTDTGSFRFPNCNSKTHRIIANLLDNGVDHTYIHDQIYATFSQERLKMTGYVITNNLILDKDWAIIWISNEEKKKFNYKKGDTESLVNYPLSVLGIRKVAFISQSDNGDSIRFSLRSKGDYDVSKLCRENLHGGGHKNASGGSLDITIDKAIDIIKELFNAN